MKRLMELLKISETAAIMCMVIGVLFILCMAAGIMVSIFVYPFEAPLPYSLGLLLGCLLSEAKVILLEKALIRSSGMDVAAAKGYASLMAVSRYMLTVVVVLPVFFFREIFGLVGVIIGILSLQAAAYITGHIIKKIDVA